MPQIQSFTMTASDVAGLFTLTITLQVLMLLAVWGMAKAVAAHRCGGMAHRPSNAQPNPANRSGRR